MYIYRILINRNSDKMSLVPYNFYPEYSVEEINSRQVNGRNYSAATPFLYDSNHFTELSSLF